MEKDKRERCLLHETVRPAYVGIFRNVRCSCPKDSKEETP